MDEAPLEVAATSTPIERKPPGRLAGTRYWLSILLVVVGATLLFIANIAFWVRGTVYNEENFVNAADTTFQQEGVQEALARRITTQIVVAADLQTRLEEELGDRLQLLATPLLLRIDDLVYDAVLAVLQSEQFQTVYRTALGFVHEQIIRIIDGEDGLYVVDDNTVALDLRPLVLNVLERLGLGDTNVADRLRAAEPIQPGEEQTGVFLISSDPLAKALNVVRAVNRLIIGGVILAFVLLALAVLVAVDRRRALGRSAVALIVVGLASLLVIMIANLVARQALAHGETISPIMESLTRPYRGQSAFLLVVGAVILAGLLITGGSKLAVAARRKAQGKEEAGSLEDALRDTATTLRVTGIAVAVVLLVAWPGASQRTQLTIIGLLVVYLIGVWVAVSDAGLAKRMREPISGFWSSHIAKTQGEGWFAPMAPWLRVVGIVAAILAMLSIPGLTLAGAIAIVVATLVYLAVVDMAASRFATASE
jgi:hypothetical protein